MPPSVLIVDDEPAICDNLAAFLEDEGMRAEVAHSGEQAVDLISGGLAVDVCIMDLRLPGMNGAQTILALRHLAPGLRFIVHTGSASDKVAAQLSRNGLESVPVFNKPVQDMAQFAAAVTAMWAAAS